MKRTCNYLILLGIIFSASVSAVDNATQQGSETSIGEVTESNIHHPYSIQNPYRLHSKRHKHRFKRGLTSR